jgi:hypothetical protein
MAGTNNLLLAGQATFLKDMNHVIEVVTYSESHDNYGNRTLSLSDARQYKCLIQQNEDTKWTTTGSVDTFPYVAYVLSIPINGVDAVPIAVEEQITVINPVYMASKTPRRLGVIKSYPDQYGNLFVMTITFE